MVLSLAFPLVPRVFAGHDDHSTVKSQSWLCCPSRSFIRQQQLWNRCEVIPAVALGSSEDTGQGAVTVFDRMAHTPLRISGNREMMAWHGGVQAQGLGVPRPPKAIPHFPGEGDWVGSQMPFCVLSISKHP